VPQAQWLRPMIFQINNIQIDLKQFTITREGEVLEVEPKVFDTIVYLVKNRDRLVSRDELFENVWNGRLVSDTSLSNHIKSARKLLGDDGDRQEIIKTVRGRGYQFVASVEELSDSGSSERNEADTQQSISSSTRLSKNKSSKLLTAFIGVVLLGGLLFAWSSYQKSSVPKSANADEDTPYILVVPFDVLSADESSWEPFADQMTRELIQDLRKVSGLKVVPPPSAFTFKADKSRTRVIEKLPDVHYVLDGVVKDSGQGILRLTLELESMDDNSLVWDGDYDIELKSNNAFDLQTEIAASVTKSLEVIVLDEEMRELAQLPTSSIEAYKLFAQGQYQYSLMSRQSVLQAIDLYSAALELDPKFEDAYIAKSDAYRTLMILFEKPKDALPKVITSAIDVFDVNPESARARASLGVAYVHSWLWDDAWKMLSEARQRDPSITLTEIGFALYYSGLGEVELMHEALATANKLDPLNEELAEWGLWSLMLANELDEARVWGEEKIQLLPDSAYPLISMSVLETISGNHERSQELASRGLELAGRYPWPLLILAQSYAAAGNFEQAKALEAEAEAQNEYICPYESAVIRIYEGKYDEAFELMNDAVEFRSNCLMFTRNDPRLAPLRGDARFEQLLLTVGLDDATMATYKR
jgi:DNA-binding winged helix-turn-helix (wHTH) protein/TolB-like protein/Tfp pilus assembly protein PilF